MWAFGFYRFYVSIAVGAAVYFLLSRSVWAWIAATAVARAAWLGIEYALGVWTVKRDFSRHIATFRQQLGPYGIRIANKAEDNPRVKKSLAEVFVTDRKKLEKAVEQLEVMDALFRAGMRPDGDEYLLHDLKLKYGKRRLENGKQKVP
jgi:hypothetical protein